MLLASLLACWATAWAPQAGALLRSRLSSLTAPCRRIPLMQDDEGEKQFDLNLLQQRMEDVRTSEASARAAEMMTLATNWRVGRCTQRTLLVLEDWVRRLRCARGMVACGTYAGDVVIADMESGEVVRKWEPEGEEQSEVTAIDFDGEHVSSGDAGRVGFARPPWLRV